MASKEDFQRIIDETKAQIEADEVSLAEIEKKRTREKKAREYQILAEKQGREWSSRKSTETEKARVTEPKKEGKLKKGLKAGKEFIDLMGRGHARSMNPEGNKPYKVLEGEETEPKKELRDTTSVSISTPEPGTSSLETRVLSAQEEERIRREIAEMPKAEREKVTRGVHSIGFRIEKWKSDWFARTFDKISKKGNQKGITARFTRGLRDSYKKDADMAEKKAKVGKNAGTITKLSNVAYLAKNILRPLRLIADATGISPAGVQRIIMIGAMASTRITGAMKEARLADEEVLEKNRIDIEKAEEEAWKIYERAQERAQKKVSSQEGEGNVSALELKTAYLHEMPKDLQERMKNTSVASGVIQGILRKHLDFDINRLNNDIKKIEEDVKLSETKKGARKEQLLRRWEKKLTDYDRVLTQIGTVDGWAMAFRYAEASSKNVVRVMTAQTLYLTLDRVWDGVAHLFSGSDASEAVTPVVKDSLERVKATPDTSRISPDSSKTLAELIEQAKEDSLTGARPDTGGVAQDTLPEARHDSLPGIHTDSTMVEYSDSTTQNPDFSDINKIDAPGKTEFWGDKNPPTYGDPVPPTSEPLTLNQDAIVGKGEGITHAFARQVRADPEKFGFTGDVNDKNAMARFTLELAKKFGYADDAGNEIRVGEAGTVAYELNQENGHLVVNEKTLDGKIIDTNKEGDVLEQGGDVQKYEYQHRKPEISPTDARAQVLKDMGETPDTTQSLEEMPKGKTEGPEVSKEADVTRGTGGRLNPDEFLQNRGGEEISGRVTRYDTPPDWTTGQRGNVSEFGTYRPYNSGRPVPGAYNDSFRIPPELIAQQLDQISQSNIAHVFPENTENMWRVMSEEPVRGMLEMNEANLEDENISRLVSYLHKLQNVTGLEPKGKLLFLRGQESTGDYIERALQRAAEMGVLDKVRA